MGSVEVVSSRLESLPPRPPTPPRETSLAADATTSKHLLVLPPSSDPRSSLQTPPSVYSPLSGADSTNPSGRRARKRVGFSAKAQYNEPPNYPGVAVAKPRSSPLSAPSSTQPKPVKSILKQTSSPSPLSSSVKPDSLTTSANISDMLESTVKQLAGADRDSKRDAYTTLVMTLKTSNNLPDRIALQSKMGLFVQFTQRDITSKNATSGGPDAPLVNNALSLLATFLHFPAIASTIPNDFGIFFIDHCIRSFEDPATPKDVARHLMQAVATQDFSAKVLTSDRVRRLMNALHNIEDNLKGKSIVMSRILIYKRLVQQSRQLMVLHSDWLNDLFTDMLSRVKELRSAAISLGLEAVYIFGKEKSLSRKVMELFDTSIEEMKFAEYYHQQLRTMAKDKDDRQLTASVPKIWSVIIGLLRCPLDKWQFFNQWLQLIQMGFNNSDHPQTKQEANFAWNRFVWSMHTEGQSFVKLLPILYQPLGSQLKSKYTNKHTREVVFGSVCNLLYYTFKPGTNVALLDTYWDICVKPLTEPPKAQARNPDAVDEHMRQMTLILTGLFDSTTPRIWREERIRETTLARPNELPAIDPKWLRRNSARVFQTLEPIMDRHFLELSDKNSQIHRLWRTLVGAIVSAASKEIKVSVDTAGFISQVCGLLLKHWENGLAEIEDPTPEMASKFLDSARELIIVAVEAMGLRPFTEKMISLGRLHTFTPVSTPSHKPAKNAGDARTPLQHLMGLVSRLPPGIPDGEEYVEFFKTLFAPFLVQKSANSQSELAQEMLSVTPIWSPPVNRLPYAPLVFAAECLLATFSSSQNSAQTTSSTGQPSLGHEYRTVVRFLERGWKETPNLPWKPWCSLFLQLSTRSSQETGEAGRALGTIEPLAKVIRESIPADHTSPLFAKTLLATTELLHIASLPLDRQALEAARRRLWGTAVAGPRSSSFDPFDNFYKLVNELMERLYEAGEHGDLNEHATSLLKECGSFLARCNPELVCRTVSNLESGLAMWIRDSQGILKARQSPATSEAVMQLWETVSKIILPSGKAEEVQLDNFEELVCAAFESKHRHIVNSVAEAWNRIYENAERIQYPEHLKAVLLAVQPVVDIVLPGLEIPSVASTGQNRSFVESQDDIEMLMASSTRSSRNRSQRPATSNQSSPLSSVKLSLSAKKQLDDTTPKKGRGRPRRSAAAKARLRHDDSQIQFAPIEKSPLNPAVNAESQVLTERQKEIRERQKDTAALYPELRSSPQQQQLQVTDDKSAASNKVIETPKDVTPKRNARYEEFVSSTPTPRRGQTLAMADNDQEMTDPPSSPLEPRPFPLLPQIKSRSSSRSELENWQFSSSPVSGSPSPDAVVMTDEPTELNLADSATSQRVSQTGSPDLSAVDDSFQMATSNTVEEPELPPPAFEAAKGTLQSEQSQQEIAESFAETVPGPTPSTPKNNRVTGVEEPRSGQEVFVDAPSSPQPTVLTRSASRAAAIKDRSFEMSDGDENSMLRLVVELDRRRCELPINDYPAISPPKSNKGPRSAKKEKPAVLDCITVRGEDDEEEEDGEEEEDEPAELALSQVETRARKSKSRSPGRPSTPVTRSAASSPGKSARKRKRGDAPNHDTRHKKRKSTDASEIVESSQITMSPVLGEETPRRRRSQRINANDSPSKHSVDLDAEVNSQLVNEQEEADFRASQSFEEPEPEQTMKTNETGEDFMDVDVADVTAIIDAADAPVEGTTKDVNMIDNLSDVLASLRSVALSREEVYKMEDMLMDIKRELFAAEARGRV
ncbi:Rap1-interacting factor 1 N terminal-domain-containing protein [Colletotrichum godetiae]|uniref:Rap1-interacting factor 1 N terminal-domain-containing protein n=1 Tax=Colletotrichum godetiae TaxID=1209918 RepID=A0AAJ0AE74_9PEZI|nr:Rap1-interacting factor 1 N terminal-domain-containing protein [Colletotrichum godetiae]KAK1672251.1 Rap1-interacting factor 1 N terminal-domain-containing protein [Colletotrichum godetiae]